MTPSMSREPRLLRHQRLTAGPPSWADTNRDALDELIGDRVEVVPDVVGLRAHIEWGAAFSEDERGLPARCAGAIFGPGRLSGGPDPAQPTSVLTSAPASPPSLQST
jgi:hypothetical protein